MYYCGRLNTEIWHKTKDEINNVEDEKAKIAQEKRAH